VPIPKKLIERGVTDMVRVSDARMSGTAFGTVVLHVAPESAVAGPLALVEDGDPIVLDVEDRRLDLDIPDAELQRRAARRSPGKRKYRRGYGALYLEHVLQANEGCDFDFLRAYRARRQKQSRLACSPAGWEAGSSLASFYGSIARPLSGSKKVSWSVTTTKRIGVLSLGQCAGLTNHEGGGSGECSLAGSAPSSVIASSTSGLRTEMTPSERWT